jgi:hypothetical protein
MEFLDNLLSHDLFGAISASVQHVVGIRGRTGLTSIPAIVLDPVKLSPENI